MSAAPRPVPAAALDTIKRFEGLRLCAYRCPAGVWTIGYGHTGSVRGAPLGARVTIVETEADTLLTHDAEIVAKLIDGSTHVELTSGQRAALISFAYNVGVGALLGSTLWRLLQRGDSSAAAKQFSKWVHANGRELPGLVRRREAEHALFVGP